MVVLWPMDRAVDGGEGQPGPELVLGDSCGVHSWIDGGQVLTESYHLVLCL